MKRINLLYVITKLELGGAQKQLLALISGLDKNRYSIFLFTNWEGLLFKEALSIEGLNIRVSKNLACPINPLKDFLALIEICRFIRKNNIEIVHTHSSKAGILGRFAAKLADAKIILHTVHGWPFHNFQPRLVRKLFIWLERIAAKFTDRLIVVSDFDKQTGLKNKIGRETKYQLIHYGINLWQFNLKDEAIKRELGIMSHDLVVGMIGCFKPQKSPLDFIKVAGLVCQAQANVKFILVGDGVLRKKIETLTRKLDLRGKVILTGWRKDIPKILSAIDIFVLTSLWEGMPISVLEALASAKAVVATNTGGIAEIVLEGETGFLIPPGDIKAMSERLIILLKDANLRNRLGDNAGDFLDLTFSSITMVKAHSTLYEYFTQRKYFSRAD